MNKKFKLLFFCIYGSLFLVFLIVIVFTPTIKLKSGDVTIEYNSKYIEPGYTATFFGKDYSSKVSVSGKVNTKKLGDYYIHYRIKNFIADTKVTRKISVVDTTKPRITLVGKKNTYVCPNKKYKEEGYSAIDNYDGTIDKKVNVKISEDKIEYSVSDSNSNKTKIVRNIIYEDKKAPTISLKGPLVEYIPLNSLYTEKGYSSVDYCDGNVDNLVKISGGVDTKKAGTYILTYTAYDKSGNSVKKERKVHVQNMNYSASGCGVAGAIYLTFDDGPFSGSTTTILDVLKEEGVKATFFVTNNGPDSLLLREYKEGHTIGLHTSSHNYSFLYSSDENYYKDLNSVSSRVKRVTGYDSKFIRFPGGSSNTISRKYSPGIMSRLSSSVVSKGYKYYDWNVDSDDAGSCSSKRTSDCVYRNVVNSLSKNKCNMILMHDTKGYTAAALKGIIEYGKKNGYIFMQIDEYTPMVKQKINN